MNDEKIRKKVKEPIDASDKPLNISKHSGRAAFEDEENQVLLRDKTEDLQLHDEAISSLHSIIKEVHDIKGQPNNDDRLDELRTQGLMHFMMLKKLNRINHFRGKHIREVTNESKHKSEMHYLKLQNLLYEILHFEKEISKCLQFRSEDEDIVLIAVKEFYEQAPKEISKPDITLKDAHEQTLARLHWELEERKRLSQRLQEISSDKESIVAELSNKKKYLEDLKPMLNTVINATKPIQEQLDMPYSKIQQLHEKASHLPPPLYALYLQVEALSMRDKAVTGNICGDWNADTDIDNSLIIFEDDSDSEDENEKKHHRRSTSESQLQNKKERLFRKHPLSVAIDLIYNDMKLSLMFHYFTSLNLVTLFGKFDVPLSQVSLAASASDLFDGESLLVCLYPDDDGTTTPNPNNLYFLNELGIKDIGESLLRENGRAYKWVQKLCGLLFLTPKRNTMKEDTEEMGDGQLLKQSLKLIKKRMKNRASLVKQLASLENNMAMLTSRNMKLFPTRIISTLKQWKRITFNNYIMKCCNKKIVENNFATKSDYIFSGIIERKFSSSELQVTKTQEAHLLFYVVLNVNYPSSIPIFTLVINYGGEQTASNNEHIREMESAVNFDWPSSQVDDLILTNQVLRLKLSFDIYLECLLPGFGADKMMIRKHKGRCRSLPYNYDPEMKIYTQRYNYNNN